MTIELQPNPNQNNILYPNCRYNYHLIYTDPYTGAKFLETFKVPIINPTPNDLSYTIPPGYAFRPDLISYYFYDTPTLWWVICIANNIINPLDRDIGLYAGRVITIPSNTILASIGV